MAFDLVIKLAVMSVVGEGVRTHRSAEGASVAVSFGKLIAKIAHKHQQIILIAKMKLLQQFQFDENSTQTESHTKRCESND